MMCRYAIGVINVRRVWHATEAIDRHGQQEVVARFVRGSLRGGTQFRQKIFDKGEFVEKSLRPVLVTVCGIPNSAELGVRIQNSAELSVLGVIL